MDQKGSRCYSIGFLPARHVHQTICGRFPRQLSPRCFESCRLTRGLLHPSHHAGPYRARMSSRRERDNRRSGSSGSGLQHHARPRRSTNRRRVGEASASRCDRGRRLSPVGGGGKLFHALSNLSSGYLSSPKNLIDYHTSAPAVFGALQIFEAVYTGSRHFREWIWSPPRVDISADFDCAMVADPCEPLISILR
jgi:hypothetical protein